MGIKTKIAVSLCIAYAILNAWTSCPAEELRQLTDKAGNPVQTTLVEQPQDALRLWHSQGQKGRTLVVISEDLPVLAPDEGVMPEVLKAVEEGRWDDILARDYRTVRYYPVNRSCYAYVANRAGMVSGVYWIPPTKASLGDEPIENIRDKFRAMGADEAETESINKSGAVVSGNINGIPVRICNLRDIPAIDGEVLLAIDLTFFTVLYQNEVDTPFLEFFASFMQALASSGLKASDAVVSLSTAFDVVPQGHRFIGGYLREFLSTPGALADGPPEVWRLRSQAMYHETFFQVEEELDTYIKAVDMAPRDASLRYDLALAYFSMKNADRMKEELDTAVSIDRGYYPVYITYARYFSNKGPELAAQDFIEEAVKAEPNDPEVWKAKAEIMGASERYPEALAAQQKLVSLGFDGPEPLFNLARYYFKLDKNDLAIENYKKSIEMLPLPDATLRPQALMGLAGCYEKAGRVKDALDTYESALAATADQHSKMKIYEKYDALRKKWAPFMEGGKD